MAKLLIKTEGFANPVLELRMGVNHVGRDGENHFQISHPTISTHHCDLVLGDGTVLLRDCGSTNGTFVNGERVKEAMLQAGQTVHLGDVELFVETTEVTIAIPQYEHERPEPPVVLPDGAMLCPRHPHATVVWQCTACREVMCDACVHRLRRRGGKLHLFCPLCSNQVVRVGGEKPKKRGFLGLLKRTVKLPFLRSKKDESGDADSARE